MLFHAIAIDLSIKKWKFNHEMLIYLYYCLFSMKITFDNVSLKKVRYSSRTKLFAQAPARCWPGKNCPKFALVLGAQSSKQVKATATDNRYSIEDR